MSIDREDCEFDVVVNDQGQYSIWPTFRAIPAGWYTVGVRGDRRACRDYIAETWTDLRREPVRQQARRVLHQNERLFLRPRAAGLRQRRLSLVSASSPAAAAATGRRRKSTSATPRSPTFTYPNRAMARPC